MVKFINRYEDEYTFTINEDRSVDWLGSFKHHRVGFKNDYSKAWEYFQEHYGGLSYEDFIKEVHAYDEEKEEYVFQDILPLIDTTKIINMVDPSGGPYIEEGKMLSHILKAEDYNVIVTGFESIEGGYKILTKEHEYDPNDFSHLD